MKKFVKFCFACSLLIFISANKFIGLISILTLLSSWNELLISMLLISDPSKKTLPNGLMGFITEYNSEYTQLAAGIMISIIPAILFYAFAQEKIEKGMIAGAIKG